MLGVVANREQRRVELRVQGLDAAVEDLRRARQLLDVRTSTPASRSAAAVPPVETISIPSVARPAREVGDARLVGDRDQRAADPDRLARRLRRLLDLGWQ